AAPPARRVRSRTRDRFIISRLLHQGSQGRYFFAPLFGGPVCVEGETGAAAGGCSPRSPASAPCAALEPGGTRRRTELKSRLAELRSPRAKLAKPRSSRASE